MILKQLFSFHKTLSLLHNNCILLFFFSAWKILNIFKSKKNGIWRYNGGINLHISIIQFQ